VNLSMLKRLGGTVFLILCATGSFLAAEASPVAAATGGTASARPFDCYYSLGTRQVQAYPPIMTSVYGGLETVAWWPELYKWNGSSWVSYPSWPQAQVGSAWVPSLPSYYYTQTNGGFATPWFVSYQTNSGVPGAIQMQYFYFRNLPAGYYAVLNHYFWASSGGSASQWSTFGGGYYCQFS